MASGPEVQARHDDHAARGAGLQRSATGDRRLPGDQCLQLGAGALRSRQSLRERVRGRPESACRVRHGQRWRESRAPTEREIRR